MHKSAIRLHQNRKDFVMRTKNEYYTKVKQQKNIYEQTPTFTPQINKAKKITSPPEESTLAAKDHAQRLLEKGKEYKEKQELLAKLKEQSVDPDLTFKPKVNDRKPKNSQNDRPKWE